LDQIQVDNREDIATGDGPVHRPARVVPLPQTTTAVFDQSFDLLKSQFVPLMLTVGLVLLPVHLLQHYVAARWLYPLMRLATSHSANPDILKMLTAWTGVALIGDPRHNPIPGLVSLLVPLLVSAPVALCVADVFASRQIDIGQAFQYSLSRVFSIATVALFGLLCCLAVWLCLTGALTFVLTFCLGLVAISLGSTMSGILGDVITSVYVITILVTPYVVTCLFYGRTFAFVVPAIVIERMGTLNGVWRSQQLAGSVKYGTTLLIFCLLPLLIMALQYAMIYGCQQALLILHLPTVSQFLADALIVALVTCVLQAYWMVFVARLYYDYRIKRECLDLRIMMDEGAPA